MGKSDNHEIPGELLSAWCDGELSLEEQARVEQLLHDSPAARREAEEIAQLSELLKSLPRETAPPELISSTMRRCEREMLLGTGAGDNHAAAQAAAGATEQPAAPQTQAIPQQPAAGGSRSFFRSTAAAVTGLALSLLFVVTVAWQMGVNSDNALNSQAEHVARTESFPPAANEAADSASELVMAREEDRLDREAADSRDGLFAARATESVRGMERGPAVPAPSAEPAAGVARMAVRDELNAAPAAGPGNRPEASGTAGLRSVAPADQPGRLADIAWQQMRAGDIVRVLEREDGQIAVVELTVVDVSQSLGELQILLSRQAIAELEGDSRNQEAGDSSDRSTAGTTPPRAERTPSGWNTNGKAGSQVGGDIAAVFVQSTPEQLARVIQGMQREQQFADLQLTSVVSPEIVELESPVVRDKSAGGERSASEQLTVADLDRGYLEAAENEGGGQFRRKAGDGQAVGNATARGGASATVAGRPGAALPAGLRKPAAPAAVPADDEPATVAKAEAAIAGQKKDSRSSRPPVEAPAVPGRGRTAPAAPGEARLLADNHAGKAASAAEDARSEELARMPLPTASQSFQMAASVRSVRLKGLQQNRTDLDRAPAAGEVPAREAAPAATPAAASAPLEAEKAITAAKQKRQRPFAAGEAESGRPGEKESQQATSPAARSEIAGGTVRPVRPVRVLFVVRQRNASGS